MIYRISEQLFSAVAKLVDTYDGAPPTNRERLRHLFHELGGPNPTPTEVVESWVKSWMNVTERGARLAHVGKEPLGPDAEAEVRAIFLAFEKSIMAIANRSYQNLDALDLLLASANQ
ncbi:MAG: hypothetical protein OXB99_02865 [Acidimicrobiaceae bacterium]|nr:hypothetical protein [Acidimicrobiaceae bacterium]